MPTKDVIIVGAGMVGTATGLALQRRGFDVAIVDRQPPGSETSFGNAGFIQGEAFEPYALPRDIATLWRMALKRDNAVDWNFPGLVRNARPLLSYWRNSAPGVHRQISIAYAELVRRATRDHAYWIAASGSDDMIRREGYRLIFRGQKAFDAAARKAEMWRTLYGVRYDCEDRGALAASEPALRQMLAGAIRWRDTWNCNDPGGLVKAYATLLEKRGGRFLQTEFLALAPAGAGWRVTTSAGELEAEHVVLALGPWSPQALAPLGYRVRLVPKRGYHLHYEYPVRGASSNVPVLKMPVIDGEMSAVYAPMHAGLRIATGADLSNEPTTGIPRQLVRAHAAASELLDIGRQVEIRPWNGVRPCLPDMLPMVGAAPRHRGLWLNFGHGHQGFTLGPTTGELLAGVMAGEPEAAVLPLLPLARGLG